MAHFAEINENNIVINIRLVNNLLMFDENGVEQEQLGIDFLKTLSPEGRFVQCSYNGNKRHQYPAIGFTYNQELDAFITPQPYPSWTFNPSRKEWEAPVPRPEDDGFTVFIWNEFAQNWHNVTIVN